MYSGTSLSEPLLSGHLHCPYNSNYSCRFTMWVISTRREPNYLLSGLFILLIVTTTLLLGDNTFFTAQGRDNECTVVTSYYLHFTTASQHAILRYRQWQVLVLVGTRLPIQERLHCKRIYHQKVTAMISTSRNKMGPGVWFKSVQHKNKHFNAKTFVPLRLSIENTPIRYTPAEPPTIIGKVQKICTDINNALRSTFYVIHYC